MGTKMTFQLPENLLGALVEVTTDGRYHGVVREIDTSVRPVAYKVEDILGLTVWYTRDDFNVIYRQVSEETTVAYGRFLLSMMDIVNEAPQEYPNEDDYESPEPFVIYCERFTTAQRIKAHFNHLFLALDEPPVEEDEASTQKFIIPNTGGFKVGDRVRIRPGYEFPTAEFRQHFEQFGFCGIVGKIRDGQSPIEVHTPKFRFIALRPEYLELIEAAK